MVRNYDDRPLPPGALDRILENALHAPSAGFSQGWAFVVLEGAEQTAAFWDASFGDEDRAQFTYDGLFRAPVVVICLSHKQAYLDRYAEPDKGWTDKSEAHWPVPYWDIDTGFASLLMLLTAVDAGLGALFFGIFPERVAGVRAAFGIPGEYTPIGAIAIGYTAPDTPSPSLKRGRRPQEAVIHRAGWQEGSR